MNPSVHTTTITQRFTKDPSEVKYKRISSMRAILIDSQSSQCWRKIRAAGSLKEIQRQGTARCFHLKVQPFEAYLLQVPPKASLL